MKKTDRTTFFVVVDGSEITIPDPTEEQLIALAAGRVGGNVTHEEFLAFPGVRDAMVQLYKRDELAKAKKLIEAENAARLRVLELARQKLMDELAEEDAAMAPAPKPAVVVEESIVVDRTAISGPVATPALISTPDETKIVARPPMPKLGQGEVLSDYRALGIVNDGRDPQTGDIYSRFAKPKDLLQYKDQAGNWWCMVTGKLMPDNLIMVVGAVLVCEKTHAERLAKKLVNPRTGQEQHPYGIRGTLDWLENKANAMPKPVHAKPVVPVAPAKSPERLAEEEKIRAAVSGINSVSQMVSDGLRLLHMHQPGTWQFRATQAMLSSVANGLITQFEAELPEKYPNRGSTTELQKELDSVLEKKRASSEGSFESFLFHRIAGVLIRHRNALQRPMSAPGSVPKKHKPDKAGKLAKHARSLGINPNGMSEQAIRSAIADREAAKGKRKGAKPQGGRRS